MSKPESTASIAARLAAEVGVNIIIAASKFCDNILGGSPKLRPPAFDEAEAQRFLSDGAEELAVAEEREEVSEPCPGCGTCMPGFGHFCPPTPSNPAGAVDPLPSTGGVTISAPGSRSEAPVAADAPGPSSPVRAVDPGQPTYGVNMATATANLARAQQTMAAAFKRLNAAAPALPPIILPEPAVPAANERSEHPQYRQIQDQADAAVVRELLTDHAYRPSDYFGKTVEDHCACGGRPIDYSDWLTHVAPLIVAELRK